jgi:hypothetical protein
MQFSREINKITIVSGRDKNLENMVEKIHKAIPAEKRDSINFEICPYLDYFENLSEKMTFSYIREKLMERYSSDENIWWIHNYHLGKNPFFTKALLEIIKATSQKMILQIHDFPECSRYSLLKRIKEYIKEDLYPQNHHVKYAVINSRDQHYLVKAGIDKNSVYLLENPITITEKSYKINNEIIKKLSDGISDDFPGWIPDSPYMLYPVRAIRRKNVAEAALIASLSRKNVIITLPGVSESEKNYSQKCLEIFRKNLAPGMFGIGFLINDYGISFDELIASSSLILSSSVQEGFGYLFLNSMNWGKPLIAKDLDILDSFKNSFSGFPATFYDALYVPLDKNERDEQIDLYLKKTELLSAVMKEERTEILQQNFRDIFSTEQVDFSYLSLDKQIDVLEKIQKCAEYRLKCIKINNKIINIVENYCSLNVSQNHEILNNKWSFESYAGKADKILSSLCKDSKYKEQKGVNGFIYKTLESYFASPGYLRLIYDE